jgi:ferrochelatase
MALIFEVSSIGEGEYRMPALTASPFAQEPPFTHGTEPRTAVLFCNLGTPDSPTPPAVRRFLAEFLSDHRVVEIPRLLWMLILHGIILRVRPAKSAAKYASIWTTGGSPLKVWTEKQARLLQEWLAQCGQLVKVQYAMRYGSTSIASQLDKLKAEGVTRILILPAYPQYSATTTASIFDAVYTWAACTRQIPELRFVNRYHDDPGYINALAASVCKYWQANGRPDQLVMSFHGVPERTLYLGDPYHCECLKTARLLAQQLDLRKDQFKVSFQSRLGRAKWLEPYTEPTLIAMGQAGVERVDVVCPGFNCDGLETLEEINQEGREAFLHAGGKDFHYIPCLNDDSEWITALCNITQRHLQGWPTQVVPDAAGLAASRAAALALGAAQ